jgi:putative transposase
MTDVTQDRDQAGAELSAADEQVLRERARSGGLKLTGEGGLLGKLTKMVIEGALEGELDDHLGYGKHDPEGRDGGNSRKWPAGQDGVYRHGAGARPRQV